MQKAVRILFNFTYRRQSMGIRSSRKFVLTLQPVNGGGRAITFEVTPNKADKVIALLMPEIEKSKKNTTTSSITLDNFFSD